MYLEANYHTHTFRCRHASGTERDYIENAIAAGMKVLGFSDHTPYYFDGDYYSGFRMRREETADYFKTLSDLRDEYKNEIKILIGFETEYYPKYFEKLLDFYKNFPVEYIILGQHFLNNENDSGHHVISGTSDEKLLVQYVDQVIEAMKTGKFIYMAHPDALRFDGDDDVYVRHMSRICETAKELRMPLEYNFLGKRDGRHYPCRRFFRIAAEYGNDIIFGCDAHSPDAIGNIAVYEAALKDASDLGLKIINSVPVKGHI